MANQHYTHESATYDGLRRLSAIPITIHEGAAMLQSAGVYATVEQALSALETGAGIGLGGDPNGIYRRIQRRRD